MSPIQRLCGLLVAGCLVGTTLGADAPAAKSKTPTAAAKPKTAPPKSPSKGAGGAKPKPTVPKSKSGGKKVAARPAAKPAPATKSPVKPSGEPTPAATEIDPASIPEGHVLLRYKFQPGEIVRWNVTQSLNVETSILETTKRAKSGSTSLKAWEATTVEASGKITLVHRVEAVEMWQKETGRVELRYDSRSGEEPPPAFAEVASSTGVPLSEFTIDGTGKILRRTELREGQAKARDAQILPLLPVEAVTVGSSWKRPDEFTATVPATQEGEQSPPRKIGLQQRYKVTSIEGDIVTIEIRTEVLTPIDSPLLHSLLVQELVNGEFEFSVSRGRIVRRKTVVDEKVVGFQGAQSRMILQIELEEKLVDGSAETPMPMPNKPAPPANAAASDAPASGAANK